MSKFSSPFMAKSPLNNGKYKKGDLLDETDWEELGTGYNIQDVSEVQSDDKGQFVTTLGDDEITPSLQHVENPQFSSDPTIMPNALRPDIRVARDTIRPSVGKKFIKSPLNQNGDEIRIEEPKVDIGTALSISPGYEQVGEKAKKVKGKLGRKQRKLGRIEDDIADISNRIMHEKTPNTISQKADRKMKKYFKTQKQIQEIKNN